MPSPSYTYTNGQSKAVFRWADNIEKRNRLRLECFDEMQACQYKLLTPMDRLLPFQFTRPFSVLGITSWEVYNLDGTVAATYGSTDRALLTIGSGETFDTITYNGDALTQSLDQGFYYSKIVTDGHAYYSEDFYVMCADAGGNQVPSGYLTSGLNSEANPSGLFTITSWSRFLDGTTNTPGDPPSGTFVGQKIANFGDDLLYTWNGSAWTTAGPADGIGWYDNETGNWYQSTGGVWSGMVSDPVEIDGTGITWGAANIPVTIDASDFVGCLDQSVRIEIVSSLSSTGTVAVTLGGSPLFTLNGNETETATTVITGGDTLVLTPAGGYDGYITAIRIYCLSGVDYCHMRLEWTNCGTVGNLDASAFTQRYYLPLDTIRPRAETKLDTEYEEDDDGNSIPVRQRKEVSWFMFLGVVPWYVADALTEMCLHNDVRLIHPDQEADGVLTPELQRTDVMLNPKVEFTRNDSFSKCLVPCRLTFELDNTSVSCCDTFDPPCKTACADAKDFVSNYGGTGTNGDIFLSDAAPTYQSVLSNVLQTAVTCTSGHATILDISYLWKVNTSEWVEAGVFGTITETTSGDGCTQNILATLQAGYSAILQYKDVDEEWADDDQYDLSAAEWADNDIERETPADEHADKELRLKIYVGDCVLGYSDVAVYTCP